LSLPSSELSLVKHIIVKHEAQNHYSAVEGGADRLELCANLGAGGGTTPSVGLLKLVKQAVNEIPIMASSVTYPFYASHFDVTIPLTGDDTTESGRFHVL
jgi:hypothetical protein